MAGFCNSARAQGPALASPNTSAIDLARQQTSNVQPFAQQSLPLGVNTSQLPVSTAGDLDLGIQVILKRKQAEQPFRFFADTAEFYTNNVALTRNNRQADSYFFADVGFTYSKKITEDLTFETTVRQGFFRYSSFSELDFEDLNAGAGLTYEWKKAWDINFFGRYNFERFTDGSLDSDFFRNHTITVGAQKTFNFKKQGDYAYVGYSSIFGWATPTASQRDEHGIFLGAHYNFTPKFTGDIYYRVAVFDYSGRTDLNNTMVATLAYYFNDYAKLTASLSYASDKSNHSVYDYDLLTTGGGLAFQLRF